jgi:predicted nucleotidyltransferase
LVLPIFAYVHGGSFVFVAASTRRWFWPVRQRRKGAAVGDQTAQHLPLNLAHAAPHLVPAEAHLLQRTIERLVPAYRPQQIYLFGSKARNDAGPDSDFDLFVVVPDTASRERTFSWLANAAIDLRAAEHALTVEPPLNADSAFHF